MNIYIHIVNKTKRINFTYNEHQDYCFESIKSKKRRKGCTSGREQQVNHKLVKA